MVEICQFRFTSPYTRQDIDVKGRESSWYDLKHQFNRQSEKFNSSASYYQTISITGPRLFAIVNHSSVFYHHNEQWYEYKSERDIECDLIASSELNFSQPSSFSTTTPKY